MNDANLIRPIRLEDRPQSVRDDTLTFSGHDSHGPLTVSVGVMAFDRLQLAFPSLDADDRRDAALLEIEQLAGHHLAERGGDRFIRLMDDEVNRLAERQEQPPSDWR